MQQTHLLQLADQCVKCGYCLPCCPTFRLRRDEAESPRGRVALIQGLLAGDLEDGARLGVHLGNCMGCLACEPACPSLVQFGELMDGARAHRLARRPRWRRVWSRIRLDLLAHERAPDLLARLSDLYRFSGLASVLLQFGLLRRGRLAVLDGLVRQMRRPHHRQLQAAHAATDTTPGVALFVGCLSRGLQASTATAAATVLQRLGISVDLPRQQGCCGAMHRHNGHPDAAARMLAHNQAVFARNTTPVGFASACVAELRHGLDAAELCRFLLNVSWPPAVTLRPLPALAAVHEPCSHRNTLRDASAVYALLARIPELRVVGLAGNEACCGAAGTYLLDHAETALSLAAEKVLAVTDLGPRYLVTTNTGCAVHLAARLRAAGLEVEVLHPVELIERQLT